MTQQTISPAIWVPTPALAALHESWLAPLALRSTKLEQGWTDAALRREWKAGNLARPRRGAYADGPAFRKLDALGRHAMTSRAVLLQSPVEMSLSHSSALPWFGSPEWGLDLSEVDVTRHDRRAGRREAGICQHRGEIVDGDVIEIYDLSLVTACRALLELTTVAPLEVSLAHVNHLLHTDQVTLDELWSRYELMTHWPGTLNTEIVLRLATALIESILESRFYFLCFRHSLPMPVPQYVVEDVDGRLVARLDFAWPELGKYVECDGKVKYEKYLRPGQRASDVVVGEKEREKLVRRLTGMECERFIWADLEHEARTVARLRAFLFGS